MSRKDNADPKSSSGQVQTADTFYVALDEEVTESSVTGRFAARPVRSRSTGAVDARGGQMGSRR